MPAVAAPTRIRRFATTLGPTPERRFSLATMRKAGHYVKNVNGKRMVVMPAPEDRPWKLRREYVNELCDENKIESDKGDLSGVESGDDVLGSMFQELVEDREAAAASAARGMTMDELLEEAKKGDTPKKQEAQVASQGKRTQPPPPPPVASSDPRSDRALAPPPPSSEKKDQWGVGGIESEDDDVVEQMFGGLKRKAAKAKAKSSAKCSKVQKAAPVAQPLPGPQVEPAPGGGDGSDAMARKRGRRRISPMENADREVAAFREANEHSIFQRAQPDLSPVSPQIHRCC